MLAKCCAYVFILCSLAMPAEAAGIQLLDLQAGLAGVIWYPCEREPQDVPLGRLTVGPIDTLRGVKDCPIAAHGLPLVVMSHGRGGYFGAHHDTAEALADAGFVVAAINHPRDNGNDRSGSDDLSVFASRPMEIIRLLDFVLHDWKDNAVVDPARIGFFGFSKGGYTGLVLIGVTPDFDRFARYCQEKVDVCERLHKGERLPNLPSDTRIKAAVIVDPAGVVFTNDNLAAMRIPFQFWRSEYGGPGVGDGSGNARVAASLPGKPEVHVLPAGHFTFLAPCSPQLALAIPRICEDVPAGFDRAAFHLAFNADVLRFFRNNLPGDGTAR